MSTRKKLTVIFCLPGNSFSGKFLQCWTETIHFLHKQNIIAILSQHSGSNIHHLRSACLGATVMAGEKQIPYQGTVDYDFIFWLDSDIIFSPKQIMRLINHDKDIVSGMYLMQGGQSYAMVEKGNWDFEKIKSNGGEFEFVSRERADELKTAGKLCEVEYNGFGFMCMKKGVFENIPYPWFPALTFNFDYVNDKGIKIHVSDFSSEDVGFCRKAIESGFKIYVDPTIRVGHEKTHILYQN
jgi:hypothetical protein